MGQTGTFKPGLTGLTGIMGGQSPLIIPSPCLRNEGTDRASLYNDIVIRTRPALCGPHPSRLCVATGVLCPGEWVNAALAAADVECARIFTPRRNAAERGFHPTRYPSTGWFNEVPPPRP